MTNRLFIGLDLPESTIEYITNLRNEIYGNSNSIKWEGEDKLHITIKFLGDVGENLLELIKDRLGNIEFSQIEAELNGFNFFVKNNNPSILYIELEENSQIKKIHSDIEGECELLGFTKEKRKFKPHLTLLRIRGKEDLNQLNKFHNLKIEHNFKISSFSLIKSELKPTGSEYTIIKSFKLI